MQSKYSKSNIENARERLPKQELCLDTGPWSIGKYSLIDQGAQVSHSWEPFDRAASIGHPSAPPYQNTPRRTHARGKYVCHITVILLACSKSATIEICEIVCEKNTILCRTKIAVDPAKCGLERTITELAMLKFHLGAERACQLTARIDGIDRRGAGRGSAKPAAADHAGYTLVGPDILLSDRIGLA